MKARLTIYDNDKPLGSYVLQPSRIREYELYTRYLFTFEWNEFNDKYSGKVHQKNDCRS